MRLRQATELFLNGYFSTCQRSRHTIQAYSIDLEQFGDAIGQRMSLQAITPELLENWAVALKEASYASTTIRRKFATLKVFFNYWVRKSHLERSPLSRIRLDLAREKALPTVLTLQEATRLLRQAKRELGPYPRKPSESLDSTFLALRNLAIVEVLLATGIRVGEMTALRISDYKHEEGCLTVQGKGARQRLALLTDRHSKRALSTYTDIERAYAVSAKACSLMYSEGLYHHKALPTSSPHWPSAQEYRTG